MRKHIDWTRQARGFVVSRLAVPVVAAALAVTALTGVVGAHELAQAAPQSVTAEKPEAGEKPEVAEKVEAGEVAESVEDVETSDEVAEVEEQGELDGD